MQTQALIDWALPNATPCSVLSDPRPLNANAPGEPGGSEPIMAEAGRAGKRCSEGFKSGSTGDGISLKALAIHIEKGFYRNRFTNTVTLAKVDFHVF